MVYTAHIEPSYVITHDEQDVGCFCCFPFAFAIFKNLMIHRSVLCHSIFIKYISVTSSFFNRYEFYCASQRQLSKGRMRPIGGRNPPPLFLYPDEPGSAESLLLHEMAVDSFLSSHSFSFPFEEMLLIGRRTMAHKKEIMGTSIKPICFVGFFKCEFLKLGQFIVEDRRRKKSIARTPQSDIYHKV
jgi:hypothetical protein